jgi:hypothetical protein
MDTNAAAVFRSDAGNGMGDTGKFDNSITKPAGGKLADI